MNENLFSYCIFGAFCCRFDEAERFSSHRSVIQLTLISSNMIQFSGVSEECTIFGSECSKYAQTHIHHWVRSTRSSFTDAIIDKVGIKQTILAHINM